MKALTISTQASLMHKALEFFFSDSEVVLFFDFESSMNLKSCEMEQALAIYSVAELYEHWNVDTLCDEIVNLYSVLASVYCAKDQGGELC